MECCLLSVDACGLRKTSKQKMRRCGTWLVPQHWPLCRAVKNVLPLDEGIVFTPFLHKDVVGGRNDLPGPK